ncbi:MAG: hypothetical protein LBC88_03125, partial [Spirochaetaceae bacterium]|nr:hypothetical protein [Spirochaetaceae bacterium]
MKNRCMRAAFFAAVIALFPGCGGEEASREELDSIAVSGAAELLSKTVAKPRLLPAGEGAFVPGSAGGVWHGVMHQ